MRVLAALLLAALVAMGGVGVSRFGDHPPPTRLVDPNDPTVVLDGEITRTFGLLRPVVWVVEASGGSIWTSPMLARVQAVTRDVFRIRGVVAPDVVSIASPNLRDLEVSDAGMRPTYLMGEVPGTPEAVAALRARVDGDPMLRGQLVDVEGRAAMIVANFRDDADPAEIVRAAVALRDRHRDADAAVWVVGEAILARTAIAAAPGIVRGRVIPVVAGALIACALLVGWRRVAAGVVAGTATAGGTLALAAGLGMLVLPWTASAALGGTLMAAVLAAAAGLEWRPVYGAAVGAVVAIGVAAAVTPGPERTLWSGLLVAVPLALGTAWLARHAVAVPEAAPGSAARRWQVVALAIGAGAAALGALGLRPAFSLASYGARYLPASVAPDLAAFGRLFPPPQSLAIRIRGEPGFVASPEVLRALENVEGAAAADPNVRHAMSIADLVKIVHRSFNDGRAEFAVVPDDRGLIARYLALAYSPGFRRFVDRPLATASLWITIDGAGLGDLRRIEDRVSRALATHPVPDATVDRFGGDGAVTLLMGASGWRIGLGAAGAVALALAGVAVGGGGAMALRRLAVVVAVTLATAGALGWCGQALDLVTVPLLAGVALVSAVACGRGRFGRERRRPLP